MKVQDNHHSDSYEILGTMLSRWGTLKSKGPRVDDTIIIQWIYRHGNTKNHDALYGICTTDLVFHIGSTYVKECGGMCSSL